MERTNERPLPNGRIPERNALIFATLTGAAGILMLLLTVNPLISLLALIALLSYTPLYTYLKGVTSLSTLVGAIPGAIPPMIGWAGVTRTVELPAVLLFLIMFIWQPPHFLALTLLRKKEYDAAGLVMLPIEVDDAATVRQIVGYSTVLLPLSLLPYHFGMAGSIYFGVAAVLGTLFLGMGALGIKPSIRRTFWSRGLFAFSILHLTVLFAGFFVDPGGLS